LTSDQQLHAHNSKHKQGKEIRSTACRAVNTLTLKTWSANILGSPR